MDTMGSRMGLQTLSGLFGRTSMQPRHTGLRSRWLLPRRLLAAAMKVNALSIQTDAHKELRAAIAKARGTPC